MPSLKMEIQMLLEEALSQPPIGETPLFLWHVTPLGIAALWKSTRPPLKPPFSDALEEGLQVGLDLSREERVFHQIRQGLVILFHT